MDGTVAADTKSMSIIVTKGSLDWAYPPFILSTTAAAMGLNVTMFFTFYGLTLLKKKLDLGITTVGNPAMQMPMFGMHIGMPNIVSAEKVTVRRHGCTLPQFCFQTTASWPIMP
jgi:peroxiredoxin family protein